MSFLAQARQLSLRRESSSIAQDFTLPGCYTSRTGSGVSSGGRFAVKSQGSTLDRRWKLPSWSRVGAEGISGGAVKCVEIGKNTNGESILLGRH
ncbi:hypothetical protein Lal_00024255 [Lupinus albus]|nr:hypothetical protein Lal_00024255 [Lupinus albus]